jgi:hypothetical protein
MTMTLSLLKLLTRYMPICYTQHTCSENNGKIIPVLNSAPRHEDVARSGGTAPPFLSPALDA